MSKLSRDRIFHRLNAGRKVFTAPSTGTADLPLRELRREEKIDKLKTLMEAMRTEVHIVNTENLMKSLTMTLKNKGINELLYAPDTDIGSALEKLRKKNIDTLPELVPFGKNIEHFKTQLFEVEASITSAAGAIADTGAIILRPDKKEPRLMSLVPPIHIAILAAERIHNSFSEVIQKENWSDRMPTNILLISGPSKTADIELTLAYGVHGPKELILFILDS